MPFSFSFRCAESKIFTQNTRLLQNPIHSLHFLSTTPMVDNISLSNTKEVPGNFYSVLFNSWHYSRLNRIVYCWKVQKMVPISEDMAVWESNIKKLKRVLKMKGIRLWSIHKSSSSLFFQKNTPKMKLKILINFILISLKNIMIMRNSPNHVSKYWIWKRYFMGFSNHSSEHSSNYSSLGGGGGSFKFDSINILSRAMSNPPILLTYLKIGSGSYTKLYYLYFVITFIFLSSSAQHLSF